MKTYVEGCIPKGNISMITLKIDGVKGICTNNTWLSRAGKPLYNLPNMPNGEYEIYLGNFTDSISACMTHEGKLIDKMFLFPLSPVIDTRLLIEYAGRSIDEIAKTAIRNGYEGLVIYSLDGEMFKVKESLTFDVEITGLQSGTGKYKDKLGAFIVKYGNAKFKVGTGFTDKLRIDLNDTSLIGTIIEIKAMSILPSGRARHPVFLRLRGDLK